MPRPVTMPIANDKRRRPERTEAIRILKPAISNIPRSVSATVAAHANGTVNELGKRDVTAPVYSTKWAKFPQDTFFAPCGPQKPKRSATADRKEAPSANRANRRTISAAFSVSCAVFEFIQGPFLRSDRSTREMQHAEFPSCLRFSFTRNKLEKSRKPSSSACACLYHDWNRNRGNPGSRLKLVNGSENRCSLIFDKKHDELRRFRRTRVTAYGMNVFG